MPQQLPQGRCPPNRQPRGEEAEEETFGDEDLYDEIPKAPPIAGFTSAITMLRRLRCQVRPGVFNPRGLEGRTPKLPGDRDDLVSLSRPPSEAGEAEEVSTPPPPPPEEEKGAAWASGEEETSKEEKETFTTRLSSGAGFTVLLSHAEDQAVRSPEPAEESPSPSPEPREAPSRFVWPRTASPDSNPEEAASPGQRFRMPKRQTSGDSAYSGMSGSDISVEVVRRATLIRQQKQDEQMSGAETEEEEEEEPAALDQSEETMDTERRTSFELEVDKSVSALKMLRQSRNFLWTKTFGYRITEDLFSPFLEQRDQAIETALADWPLNPARLYQKSEVPSFMKARVSSKERVTSSQGDLGELEHHQGGHAGRGKKDPGGLLQIAGVWKSQGEQFFYVDMREGPFFVFPEKAMVMELWRGDRLIHVGAVLMANDWKAGSGAFGRFVRSVLEVAEGDKVDFPTCRPFHGNFQDYVNSCLGVAEAT